MNRDDDGETSYNTFVDDVAFEPTYLQALPTVAGRNVATHSGIVSKRRKHRRSSVKFRGARHFCPKNKICMKN